MQEQQEREEHAKRELEEKRKQDSNTAITKRQKTLAKQV